MTTEAFIRLVETSAPHALRGPCRETEDSLQQAEEQLGVRLPASLRWFEKNFANSIVAGPLTLAEIIEDTLTARQSFNLPCHLVILAECDFGGVLILDTARTTSPSENPIFRVEKSLVEASERLPDIPQFASFGEYLQFRFQLAQEFTIPIHDF